MLIPTQIKSFRQNFPPCLGGILGGISVASHFWLIFMPISLFILWKGSERKKANFCWGFFFILISHSWLYDLHPLTWLGFSWLVSLIITISILLFCAFWGGLLVYLWGLLVEILLWKEDFLKMKILPLSVKVVFLSLTWGIGELILSQTPFFWIGLGESLIPGDIYLAGLGRWIGATGLCTLQILIGFWIFFSHVRWRRKIQFKKTFIYGLLILVFLHLLGGLTTPLKRNYEYPVAIWQTNLPTREKLKKDDEFIKEKLLIAQKYALANKVKFLVAPEGTLSNNFYLSEGLKVNTLAGGFRNSKNELRSSLLGFQIGDKSFTSFIDKNRLVPLGEKIPKFLDSFSRGLSAVGGIQSGSDSRFYDPKFAPPLAVAICYEISDGSKIRKAVNSGAKLIVTAANLDPYPGKLYNQFLSLARLRSIENRKNNLLVSNTGPSGLIQEDGKIIQLLDLNVEQNEIVFPHFSSEKTFYTKFGDKPILLLFIFFMGLNFFWKIN
ncbi:possible apolipoprotein n-acyltransferase [Prochlorococcus marinus str. MIT 9215]|uniref:Apolipoprotein N-acyltransferase n=1 Tax=Prochlorococcus marinus (strain MIT 9215) TaxID=93060 RepID=A8G6A2_PROM2|nr:apolipoprotein N-acyltransferase [Prochlorococcus marinus]ABV51133.1 possible apolipoprotein n-acyltransferase [Prochlorococcus marinus str. MIT 9215]